MDAIAKDQALGVGMMGRGDIAGKERKTGRGERDSPSINSAGLAMLRTALDGHVALVRERFLNRFSPDELGQMAAWWRRVEDAGVES